MFLREHEQTIECHQELDTNFKILSPILRKTHHCYYIPHHPIARLPWQVGVLVPRHAPGTRH